MLTAPLPPVVAGCTAVVTFTASTASCRGVTDAKNESDERRKLSLLLTPSSVMLTNDSGRPLMRDSRLVVAVLMPGRNVTAFNALRVGVGMRFNWSAFSVDDTVAVCVLINSLLAATFTVSDSWPTSRPALSDCGVPGSTRTSFIATVLNPLSATVTVYTPGATPGIVNSPSPLETASNDTPDSFLTTTAAPGM